MAWGIPISTQRSSRFPTVAPEAGEDGVMDPHRSSRQAASHPHLRGLRGPIGSLVVFGGAVSGLTLTGLLQGAGWPDPVALGAGLVILAAATLFASDVG
jgi:hypothetical protein